MRYFFFERMESVGATPVIMGSDARHIQTVLRLKPGDTIGLFDDKGFEYQAEIIDLSPGKVQVSVIHKFPSTSESPVRITVAQAFLKERKMDGLVRQLTELGITAWIPFIAERSVSRPDEKQLLVRTKRWKKISREAVKQCKRGHVMEIGETVSFEAVLDLGRASDFKVAFWENELKPVQTPLSTSGRHIKNIFALIGPEGGFSAQEIENVRHRGFTTVGLGPRILRAETATVAACVVLQYLFGDMSQKKS